MLTYASLYSVDTYDTANPENVVRHYSLEPIVNAFERRPELNYGGIRSEWVLPEGYEIGRSGMGQQGIFDPHGYMCDIRHSKSGPVLESLSASVTLKPIWEAVHDLTK